MFGKAIYLVSLAVAGLIASGSASLSQQALSGAEIRSLVEGKSYRWDTPNGFAGSITVRSDGSQSLTSNIPNIESDTGSWRIHGDQLCSRWTKIRGGDESCQTISRQSDTVYVTSTGTRMLFD